MNLIWYPITGHELPEALRDESKIKSLSNSALPSDTMLGTSSIGQGKVPQAAAILTGSDRNELLAWISTYAEEMFPLSQFCRVCSKEDWSDLGLQYRTEYALGAAHPIWPSLVLGEMLGQADAEIDVASVPLARASACFSFAVARTALLYPNHENAKQKCITRLAIADRESRFVRRHITVDSLTRVWLVATSLSTAGISGDPLQTIVRVVSSVSKSAAELVSGNQSLLSDSAEDRVVGFDSVADYLFDKRESDLLGREGSSIALAAAALLAGRGTSHIQLLAPTAKLFPESLVWFGLLSGVLGPRVWDKAWMQQTKGVERALRQFFRPDEPVSADICWPEYEWLSHTYDSREVLSTIPKSAPRSLAIEVLPGVNCQFRLSDPTLHASASEERRPAAIEQKNSTPAITEKTLAHVVQLLSSIQQLLEPQSIAPPQKFLFDIESPQRQNRAPARKKTSKTGKTSG